jgi:hypothetical protein
MFDEDTEVYVLPVGLQGEMKIPLEQMRTCFLLRISNLRRRPRYEYLVTTCDE